MNHGAAHRVPVGVEFGGGPESHVTALDFMFAGITAPIAVRGLTALQTLSLDGNSLTTPPVLTGLTALQYLSLDGNSLTTVPTALGAMSQAGYYPRIYLPNNNLPSGEVNSALAQCVVADTGGGGTLNLGGQTPAAPPTGQGITDKNTLVAAGWTVTTD